MNYQRMLDHQRHLHHEYDVYMGLSETQKIDYVSARRHALQESSGGQDVRHIKSSGTRSSPKHYKWGPYFNETYRFVLDVVTNFSVRARTAIGLLGAKFNENTQIAYEDDLCESHFIDYMIYVTPGITKPGKLFESYFDGHDVIVDPNILLLLHKRHGILDSMGDVRFFFTGSILTDELLQAMNNRWKYYDWMRSWDGGATFFTCVYGNKHWLDFLADIYVTSEGRLFSTDLYNHETKHIDYFNGDILESNSSKGVCCCGLESIDIKFQNYGRSILNVAPSGQTYSYAALRTLLFQAVGDFKLHDVYFALINNELEVTILGIGNQAALEERYTKLILDTYQFKAVTYKNYLEAGHKVHLLKVRS